METPRYRIGNDLTVLWAICNRDGSPYKLDDKVVRLFVVNQLGRIEVKPIIQSLPDGITNNVIRWDSKGREQTVLGLYSLAVEIQNEDDSKVIHKDYCDAFELVGASCDECVEEGEANIQDGGDLILTSRLDVYRFGIPQISIGTNGNWFIDGVDSGQSALAGGPGLVNKIYNEGDFGKEFEEGSVIDTFNAQAINKLYRTLNSLTLGQSIKDLDIISAKHNDVISYDGSEWRNIPFQQLLNKYAQSLFLADQVMSDTSTNAVQNRVIKKYVDAVSDRLKILEGWFKKYDDNTIYTEMNFFSKKTVASGGMGEQSGGEGGEGGGGNIPDLNGYATLVDLQNAIDNLIGGADQEYSTLGKIQNIIEDTKGDINLLGQIVEGISGEVSQYNDRLIVLEDKNMMFEWVYDENGEKTGIKTTYDFFSTKTIASGGMGEYGSGDVDNTSGITGIEVNGELRDDKDGDGIIVLPDYPSRVSQLENDKGFITKEDLKDIGDSSGMFEWADDAHTIIKTKFDLYSTKTIASGGVGQHGTNTGAGSVMAIEVNGKIYDDSDSDGVIVLPNYPTRAEYNSEMTLINGRFAALDAKDESHDISIGEHSIRISTNENDIVVLKQTDEDFERRLQRAEKITNYFDIDNDDNVYTWHNLYSTMTIASGGVGEEGDSGIDTSEFVTWEYFDELTGRIDNIDEWIANAEENGGGGSSVVYYTGLTDGLRIGAITIDEVSTDVFIPANLSEYTIDSDFVNALSAEGFITEVDANDRYALQSDLDDFLPKDAEASAAARLSDEDEYTAFGRTFFSNGKPVNITSSPIAPANGGLYAYGYDNNRVLLFYYANGGDFSELRIGSEPASRGEDVRICGYPLIMHHGSVNAGVVVAKTTVDGIVVPTGRKLYLGDDKGYHITMEYDEVTDAIRIDGNVYVTGTVASGGKAEEGDSPLADLEERVSILERLIS